MPALLEVTGLRAGYGRTEVLHGVDLRVPPGAAVALLGSNGAGKTTLLKTVAGLLPAREGHVLLQGTAVEKRPANARARAGVCLIPEGRGIFRRLTVRENLTMQVGRRHLNGSLEKATARFPKLGQRMDQVAGTLSGGEQQMLALARALVTDPVVVLADELSVGLAPVIVDEIFEALAVLRAEGRSLLLVEQYVERAVGIADYVYILQKGEIVFVGEPSQCASGVVFAAVSRRKRLTGAHAARPPSRQGLKVAAAIVAPLLVAIGLIALVAAHGGGGGGSSVTSSSSTTTVTVSKAAKAFQDKVDEAFKPLGDAIKVFLPKAQDFEGGKVTPPDFKGAVDAALPEFVKARDAVAKVEPYKAAPAVNRYFVDAADLYVEVARIYGVAADPASDPLRAQLNVAARRLRTLGDRIYDRGRVVLDPTFYPASSKDVELRPPTEVPDWVAEGMAAGPPLSAAPGPPASSPPIREATCAKGVAAPCRAEESQSKWESRLKKAGFPQPADVVAALDAADGARLGDLAGAYEAKTRTLREGPDPKGHRERAAVVELGLLTEGEAARLGQAAALLPPVTLAPAS